MANENNQMIKDLLQILSSGANCDYAPVQGGILLFDKEGNRLLQNVDFPTFSALRDQGLVKEVRKFEHGTHPIFHDSFRNPIFRYGISDKGNEYLKKE